LLVRNEPETAAFRSCFEPHLRSILCADAPSCYNPFSGLHPGVACLLNLTHGVLVADTAPNGVQPFDFSRRAILGRLAAVFAAAVVGIHAQDQLPPTTGLSGQFSPPANRFPRAGPYQAIEDAAALMKPGDPASLRAVAEAILAFPRIYTVPAMIAGVVKQRMIDTQNNYWAGKNAGTPDGAMVEAINTLASSLDMPDYARISLLQVQFFRGSLASQMPVFMRTVPETVLDAPNPPMSPFQVLFLLPFLIDQKLINPDYQAPPAEWDRDFYPRLLRQARTSEELRRRIAAGEVKPQFRASVRMSEAKPNFEMSVRQRISRMSVSQRLRLFDDTWARLGIN
jgi:hypothetical protein